MYRSTVVHHGSVPLPGIHRWLPSPRAVPPVLWVWCRPVWPAGQCVRRSPKDVQEASEQTPTSSLATVPTAAQLTIRHGAGWMQPCALALPTSLHLSICPHLRVGALGGLGVAGLDCPSNGLLLASWSTLSFAHCSPLLSNFVDSPPGRPATAALAKRARTGVKGSACHQPSPGGVVVITGGYL